MGREVREINMCGAQADLFVYKTVHDRGLQSIQWALRRVGRSLSTALGPFWEPSAQATVYTLCSTGSCAPSVSLAEGGKKSVLTERVSRKEGGASFEI